MAKAKRKPRKKAVKKVDMTKPLLPIDISKFGGEDDPCFGKLWDLTEDACKRCGDNTICGILFNQKTLKLRDKEESSNRYKDLELGNNNEIHKTIKKFVKEKKKEGMIKLKVIKKLVSKFNLSRDKAKELTNEVWKK